MAMVLRVNMGGISVLAAALAALLFAPAPRAQAGHALRIDLVRNGGFEQGLANWQFLVNGANATGQVDSTEKHSGRNSFKISNASGQAPNVYARITQTITGLRPFTSYTVSCWAKGKGCGLNWIGGGPGWFTRTALPSGDFDWRKISFELAIGADCDNYELMILSESATAALWIDDVRFDVNTIDTVRQEGALAPLRSSLGNSQSRLAALPDADNSYLRLGRAVAGRFLGSAEKTIAGDDGATSVAWSKLQLEEVAQVLDETEKIVRNSSPLLNWTPPNPGPPVYTNGAFRGSAGRQWFSFGYGHFNSVVDDLSNFPSLGVSLIQDGRFGPSSMTADGKLADGPPGIAATLDLAARAGVQVDFLLSPHYYPDWAMTPGLANGNIGFIKYNIFHPAARDTLVRWTDLVAEAVRGKPALHSICLANEPVYNSAGRDTNSRPQFIDYLRQKHGNLETLNALYRTHYTNFDDVAVPSGTMPADPGAQRAFYDWTVFNKKMFADWHGWLDATLKSDGVTAPTHTKIMVFQSLDRDKAGWGVDPELMCQATDLAGCDAYAFPGGAYAYDWIGHEFFYDLLHSFRGQTVFNSENHLIPDNSPPVHIPMKHTRAVLWQDGLHHEGSTAIWVWQMTESTADPGGLGGSIYFRPANIFGAGRAMLDLNRLAGEVEAINNAKPRVALLYSPASVFWQEGYKAAMISLYTALNFMGEPVTFVSERQLASGAPPAVSWIIVPRATHVFDSTAKALAAFKKHGGNVLLAGDDCLGWDEYDRPRPGAVPDWPVIAPGPDDRATAALLREKLKLSNTTDLRQNLDGLPAWGVEFRTVKTGRDTLIPMINLNNDIRKVSLPAWEHRKAVDLLSGAVIDPKLIALEPMVPLLIRFSP